MSFELAMAGQFFFFSKEKSKNQEDFREGNRRTMRSPLWHRREEKKERIENAWRKEGNRVEKKKGNAWLFM